ncbi:MAG: permease-like cell division protein FtsX [Patescibacteria group bacterium]|nr:permease-like cell division protein FtsX [Patescibacteria group bacterium]MDD5121248.1 permease-like cell division protein FtsX [Patescibacteria group bacterium]MDD5222091.1 permease-like cell division protein FtsX [Patescibacteria group bacterium]MDD5395833.1 permease-like cell division protein FtsX [Patescibacteria group bacterium]
MQSLKYGWQNFRRNFWLSGAVIIILILLFFSFSFLISLNILVKETVSSIRAKADLSLYLYPQVTEINLNALKTDLENFSQVESVAVISPQQALEQFKQRHQNNPDVIKSLEEINQNPFGPTFLVKIKSDADVNPVLQLVTSARYEDVIQEKDFGNYQQLINKIDFLGRKIKFLGFILSALFFAIVILMIFNAIRLSVYGRLEEIRMMRLVGATGWSIQGPFLVEILISIFIALIISGSLFLLIVLKLQPQLSTFLGMSTTLFSYLVNHALYVFGGPLIFTILTCWLAASAAMKKYLNL